MEPPINTDIHTKLFENNGLLVNEINKFCPGIDFNNIDNNLLEDILLNIIGDKDEKDNKKVISNEDIINKNIINQNIFMADEIIPEMLIPTDIIFLNGKLNGHSIKIMIDTGATSCIVFRSAVNKCNLNNLVDRRSTIMVDGAHGRKPTFGKIWFLEIELEISNGNFVNIPISVDVLNDMDNYYDDNNDNNKINNDKINNNKINDNNNNNDPKLIQQHGFEIILGMTFLKSYRVNIDFFTMNITLNNNIKIKFK